MQVQGYHTIAAVGSSQGSSVCTSCGQSLAVEGVAVTCTDRFVQGRCLGWLHLQVQGYHTIAAVGSSQGSGVCTCCGQSLTIEGVASALADCLVQGCGLGWLHRQVQSHHTIAAIRSSQGSGISTRRSQRLTIEAVAVAGTDCLVERCGDIFTLERKVDRSVHVVVVQSAW